MRGDERIHLWGGVALEDEEQEIRDLTLKDVPEITRPLARCFAWCVTKERQDQAETDTLRPSLFSIAGVSPIRNVPPHPCEMPGIAFILVTSPKMLGGQFLFLSQKMLSLAHGDASRHEAAPKRRR